MGTINVGDEKVAQILSDEYQMEVAKAMAEMMKTPTKIAVHPPMTFHPSPEMLERWHQDLRKIIDLQEKNTTLLTELYQTQQELMQAQEEVQTLEKRINPFDEPPDIGTKLNEVSKELEREKAKVANLQRLLENLKHQYQECYKVSADRLQGIEHLRAEIEKRDTQIKNLVRNNEPNPIPWEEHLKEVCQERDKALNCNTDLINAVRTLEREKAELLQRQNEHMTSTAHLGSTTMNLQQQLDQAKKDLMAKHTLICERQQTVDNLRKEKELVCATVANLEEQIRMYQRNQLHLSESYRVCDKERIQLINDNLRLEKENEELRAAVRTFRDAERLNSSKLLEVESLKTVNEGLHKTIITLKEEVQRHSKCVWDQTCEVNRLKEGRFTEEEFQALCHRFQNEDCERFCHGCIDYWVKLFGKEKLKTVLHSAAESILKTAQNLWIRRCEANTDAEHSNTAFAMDMVSALFELYGSATTAPCDVAKCDKVEQGQTKGLKMNMIQFE